MRSIERLRPSLRLAAVCLLMGGCASSPLVLYSISLEPVEAGRQHVWPYFLEGHPTVVAFWNTDVAKCLRDIPALKTLNRRRSGVELVTVVTGLDRLDIEKWMYRERIDYLVLLDLEERLAKRLDVDTYPTFIYLDANGEEIGRRSDVATIAPWFDHEGWLERSGVLTAPEDDASDDEPLP